MKIVIDHIAGSRKGQRQEFASTDRLRFGRHPDNEVAFDAHADLDASSRHAELRRRGPDYLLRDVGSSNGTFVDGQRIAEVVLEPGQPIRVEFGGGGPRVRIFLGDDAAVADLPEIDEESGGRSPAGRAAMLAAVLVLAGVIIAVIWWRFLW